MSIFRLFTESIAAVINSITADHGAGVVGEGGSQLQRYWCASSPILPSTSRAPLTPITL